MARGKAKAKAVAPARSRLHGKRYICSLHNRHHGRWTKIGIADRQYAKEKKA